MQGSTVVISPPDGDMAAYLASLERLKTIRPRLRAIAPGHGHVIDDPLAVIDETIAHRLAREAQVLDVLRDAGHRHDPRARRGDLRRRRPRAAPGRPPHGVGAPPQAGRRGRRQGRRPRRRVVRHLTTFAGDSSLRRVTAATTDSSSSAAGEYTVDEVADADQHHGADHPLVPVRGAAAPAAAGRAGGRVRRRPRGAPRGDPRPAGPRADAHRHPPAARPGARQRRHRPPWPSSRPRSPSRSRPDGDVVTAEEVAERLGLPPGEPVDPGILEELGIARVLPDGRWQIIAPAAFEASAELARLGVPLTPASGSAACSRSTPTAMAAGGGRAVRRVPVAPGERRRGRPRRSGPR